jgi:hypothetical protein
MEAGRLGELVAKAFTRSVFEKPKLGLNYHSITV